VELTFDMVMHAAAEASGCTIDEIKDPAHGYLAADARAAIVWIARRHVPRRLSWPWMGARLGGRHHATLLHADKRPTRGPRQEDAARMVRAVCERLGVPCDL
jgi:chromosomal replication initiation ATPase DnaA